MTSYGTLHNDITTKEQAMSFLDAFDDVFTDPENVLTVDSPTESNDSHEEPADYFDREDEPVIW